MIPLANYQRPMRTMEICGRFCYNTLDKVSNDSDQRLLGTIIKNGHESVIEHSRMVIEVSSRDYYNFAELIAVGEPMLSLSWSEETDTVYVSGNYRAWRDAIRAIRNPSPVLENTFYGVVYKNLAFLIEGCLGNINGLLVNDISEVEYPSPSEELTNPNVPVYRTDDGLEIKAIDWCIPDKMPVNHAMRHGALTVLVDAGSRVFTHELVRHRKNFSFSQQSQRYVDERGFNYRLPYGISKEGEAELVRAIDAARDSYIKIRDYDKKEDARYVLPNAVEAPIAVTATWDAWDHFFSLRLSKRAQAEIRRIACGIAYLSSDIFPAAFARCGEEAVSIIKEEFGTDVYDRRQSDGLGESQATA